MFNDHFWKGALPEPAITIQTKGKMQAYGWCSREEFWRSEDDTIKKYEINLSAEYMDRDPVDILQTLLHEMIHLYNAVNEIQDCSRGSQFHNKRFKAAAERFGFRFDGPADKKLGWAFPKLEQDTIDLIRSWNVPESAFKIARRVPETNKKKTNSYKLGCPSCGIKLRASKPGIVVMCKTCEIELIES
jgi:hypothetical protein